MAHVEREDLILLPLRGSLIRCCRGGVGGGGGGGRRRRGWSGLWGMSPAVVEILWNTSPHFRGQSH